jgi:LacI family transcriptional regulator
MCRLTNRRKCKIICKGLQKFLSTHEIGGYSMNNKNSPTNVTIQQVAEKAGVSTASVSRVLNDSSLVTSELKTRVLQAIEELGYYPNRAARHLRAGVVRKVGVLFADISNPFFTSVLAGIESALQQAEYVLVLGNSNEDARIEQLHLNAFLEEGVAGIIFAATTTEKERYQFVLQAGVPMLSIDRTVEGLKIDTITINNVDAAYHATNHLIDLGHKHIAFISGPENRTTARYRQIGYLQAMKDAGNLAPRIEIGNFRQEGGYQAMRALIRSDHKPSAVLVANGLMALGALQSIHEHNLAIPNEIAIVGFDDMPWVTSLQPPLTVIAQPTFEMGRIAARLLLDRIRTPENPIQRINLETQLIIRKSCGYPLGENSSIIVDTPLRSNLTL